MHRPTDAEVGVSPEVPHPQRGVRDLVVDRFDLAARMTGPGADGTVRRAAVAHLVTSRLADLWDTAVAERLWYPIWDSGVHLDHSVRSLAQCRQVASADLPAAVGLLDLRHVAGDRTVITRGRAALLTDWRAAARRRLPELLATTRTRAERVGELAYLVEPDLKETRGGIRDAVVVFALAATWLTDRPHGPVDDAYRYLLDVRDALHVTTRRPTNRLLRADQDEVAALLGVGDADDLLAGLAESGRTIAHALDTTVRHARQALVRPSLRRPVVVRRGRAQAPRRTTTGRRSDGRTSACRACRTVVSSACAMVRPDSASPASRSSASPTPSRAATSSWSARSSRLVGRRVVTCRASRTSSRYR